MANEVHHGGATDPRESWAVQDPPPWKNIITPAGVVTPKDNLAAGQQYLALIGSDTVGANKMFFQDRILTDKVWIGSATADDVSAIKLYDENNNVIPGATFWIDRVNGQVHVNGQIDNIQAGIFCCG